MNLKEMQRRRWESEMYSVEFFLLEYDIGQRFVKDLPVRDFWAYWLSIIFHKYQNYTGGFYLSLNDSDDIANLAKACCLAEIINKWL